MIAIDNVTIEGFSSGGDSYLFSTNVASSDPETPWSPSTAYVVGDIIKHNYKIWKCTLDHTSTATPPEGTINGEWKFISGTSQFKMFDSFTATRDFAVSPMEVIVFCDTMATSLSLLNVLADSGTINIWSLHAPDLVTNGNFDLLTDWNLGAGWDLSTQKAVCDGTQGAPSDLNQLGVYTAAAAAGEKVLTTVEVSVVTVSYLEVFVGGILVDTISTPGKYYYLTVPADGGLTLRASSIFAGTVLQVYSSSKTYNNDFSLADLGGIIDYWSWFFDQFDYIEDFTLIDLPPFPESFIELTLVKSGSNPPQIGQFVVGPQFEIGSTEVGSTAGIADYSKKEVDSDTGAVLLEEGRSAKRSNLNVLCRFDRTGAIQRFLEERRATPTMFVGQKDTEAINIFGYYKDFDIVLTDGFNSYVNIEIEEI